MSTDEKPKASESEATQDVTASEIADGMNADMDARDEGRLTVERSERQNLTQGMDTGTTDSIHRGVDWRPEFSVHSEPKKPAAVPDEPKGKKD